MGEIFELDRATLKSDGVFRSSPRGWRASDDKKKLNEVVINVKEWTGGYRFTSGVSPKDRYMLGEQIAARQLIDRDGTAVLLR